MSASLTVWADAHAGVQFRSPSNEICFAGELHGCMLCLQVSARSNQDDSTWTWTMDSHTPEGGDGPSVREEAGTFWFLLLVPTPSLLLAFPTTPFASLRLVGMSIKCAA